MLLRRMKKNMSGRIKMETLYEESKNSYVLANLITLAGGRAK
jgi:hypothetical protein